MSDLDDLGKGAFMKAVELGVIVDDCIDEGMSYKDIIDVVDQMFKQREQEWSEQDDI